MLHAFRLNYLYEKKEKTSFRTKLLHELNVIYNTNDSAYFGLTGTISPTYWTEPVRVIGKRKPLLYCTRKR